MTKKAMRFFEKPYRFFAFLPLFDSVRHDFHKENKFFQKFS